jgi:hypothetical protein
VTGRRVYVAPAPGHLGPLHVVDIPTVPGADGEPVDVPDARTMCGLSMSPGDFWHVTERQDIDQICPDCADLAGRPS